MIHRIARGTVAGAGRLCVRLLLTIVLLGLSGCQQVLVPLSRQRAANAQEPVQAEPVLLRVAVDWAAVPLAHDLVAAYGADELELSVDIIPTSSSVAEQLVAAGQADLALCVQPSDAGDLLQAWQDEGLVIRVLGVDALAVITPSGRGVQDITLEALAALYGGYTLDWATLGGPAGRPELVVREENSAVRKMFDTAVIGEGTISTAAQILPHDEAIVDYVASHPAAVGYVSRAYVDERVQTLTIGGVAPTAADLQRGQYPLSYRLVALTPADAAQQASGSLHEAWRLVAFASSARGRRAIEQHYVIPR